MPTAAVKFKLEGGKALEVALATIDRKVEKKVKKLAIREAVKPIIKVARALVPIRFGFLRRAIGVRVVAYRSGTVVGVIGARRLGGKTHERIQEKIGAYSFASKRAIPALYAHLVEHGTTPHEQAGVMLRHGIRLQTSQHPGAKKQPFLGPALDQTWRKAQEKMRRVIWREISKVHIGIK